MAKGKAYRRAEKKIEEALRSGAIDLDLSAKWDAEDSEKLTEHNGAAGVARRAQAVADA